MKKKLLVLLLSFSGVIAFSQTEKFDIATFVPPRGWQRSDVNGTVAFLDSQTINGLTSFCQIVLYPGSNSNSSPDKNFKAAWQNLITIPTHSKAQSATQTEKTPDGWTVITGAANITSQGVSYKSMVVTISGFGKTMSVQVNTAGGDYVSVLEKFFNNLNPDSKAAISPNQTTSNGTISMKDYDFIVPEKWQVQNNKDHIAFINPQSGCIIKVLSPQPSSGNLEQDVNAVFDLMYKGWNYQKSGDRKFILAKGFLPKGPEYFIKEATMTGTNALGQYMIEEGTAMVVKAGNQVVIISVRHNSSHLGHDECYRKYNTWKRFANSFTVKNIALPKNNELSSQRITGLWKIDAVGVAAGDYVFAANGNYQSAGGIGSSTTTSDMYYTYIYNRAYPFEGDGSYSISESLLMLKRRGAASYEQVTIRFEKVNHGGSGWKDRLYMLKKDSYGENESLYEKQEK